MKRPSSLLLYQDEPSAMMLRVLFLIIPAILLFTGIRVWSADHPGGVFLIAEGLLVGILLQIVLPRRYQIYEDRLRIALGGPFGVTLRFDRIRGIQVAGKTAFTVNLVSTFTRKYTVVTMKNGLGFAITPKANEDFVERARQAMADRQRSMA
jgi:hypothetical protein